eukprot:299077_1
MIKASFFCSVATHYCFDAYPLDGDPENPTTQDTFYATQCDKDVLCQTYKWSEHDSDGSYTSYGYNYYCVTSYNEFIFMIAWWSFIGIFSVEQFYRCHNGLKKKWFYPVEDRKIKHYSSGKYRYSAYGSDYIYCSLVCCCMGNDIEVWKQRLYESIFWRRKLWFSKDSMECCNNCIFYTDMIWKYGISLIVGSIFYGLFSGPIEKEVDFAMKWYDFYPVIILMILRNRIQIWYYKRGVYDYRQDVMDCIDKYCMDEFGNDITFEIQSFLPIFYDEKVSQTDILKLSHETIDMNDGNKETEMLIVNM